MSAKFLYLYSIPTNMNVSFFTVKGKNDVTSIYIRFADSKRFDKKTSTGLSVKFDDWSKTKQQVKNTSNNSQKDFINTKLRELKNFVFEQYNFDYNSQNFIADNWLKEKITSFFGRAELNQLHKIYFIDWVQKFIDDCDVRMFKGKLIEKRTIQHYQTTLFKLRNHEKHFDVKLRFQDIGLIFYRNFLFYCLKIEKINENTTGGLIANIKKWCKEIEIEGLPINPEYRHSEFSTISNKTKDVYLNDDEIDIIFNYDFSYSERLENVKDNFIIGLRTGLRISDFLRLKKINFKDGFIYVETKKTGQNVKIALHKQIKAILDKRSQNLPNQISDQKFNEYVKEVCKIVGFVELVEGAKMIEMKNVDGFFESTTTLKNTMRKVYGTYPKYELISSHTCRRSFASNL